MTKLTNQNLPKSPMHYCKICKEYVPDKIKHDKKQHKLK
jgi:ribosomal protein L44E